MGHPATSPNTWLSRCSVRSWRPLSVFPEADHLGDGAVVRLQAWKSEALSEGGPLVFQRTTGGHVR